MGAAETLVSRTHAPLSLLSDDGVCAPPGKHLTFFLITLRAGKLKLLPRVAISKEVGVGGERGVMEGAGSPPTVSPA